MDKLNKLSGNEYKMFYNLLPHEQEVRNNISDKKIECVLQDTEHSFSIDCAKILKFCEHIKKSPVSHQDLHPQNVMINNIGEYRLIDLDRCTLKMPNI